MAETNTEALGTAFTISIDAERRYGVSTGISAADRARTIQVALAPDARPADLRRPGHVFPLRARPGGVLQRVGQTEASVDLARLAGLQPAGVICEILNPDGSMARRPELQELAERLGPNLVVTWDNQNWGISRMNMVFRHEVLHSFYAFDEYASSGCGCVESRGYLDGRNANCNACNPAASSCVMVSNASALCPGTRRQVGWADVDGDGTVDVVGEDPDTFLDALPAPICGPLDIQGLAAVVAATNRNPVAYTPRVSVSVNRIAGVDSRVDGGAWLPAEPADGTWVQQKVHILFPDRQREKEWHPLSQCG